MKIKITREIDVPNSLTCKRCKALEEYDVENPDYRAANCCNFNDRVFATNDSGWEFVKSRDCIDATLKSLHGMN